ncbi:hypothetical protein, partial [Rhizobium leguminosarum]|uniref:hypothetical protein n=1 Tax=Rhizobium leguminosarum TaxID=384 RepID=UPI003F9683FC
LFSPIHSFARPNAQERKLSIDIDVKLKYQLVQTLKEASEKVGDSRDREENLRAIAVLPMDAAG